jgi:drug/metabolite transporter (DMT)-like permease
MMMGCYLTLSFWAVSRGLPAGVMALMGALQPLLTAAYMLIRGKELPSPSMWWGLTIGFVGVAFVLLPRIDGNQRGHNHWLRMRCRTSAPCLLH